MDISAALSRDPAAMLQSALQPSQATASRDATKADHAREVAEDFEAFFITMFLESMWAGIPTDGLMGGGQGESVFRSMLNQEHGKVLAGQGGVGLADNIHREILKLQEAAS